MSAKASKVDQKNEIKPIDNKPSRKKGTFSLEKRRALTGYVFVSPWIVGFILFMAVPLVTSLIYSFNDVQIQSGVVLNFVGWRNYIDIFTADIGFLPAFGDTIRRTVLWTPFIVVFALVLAMLLNKKIKFRGLFRVIYFLPVLLGTGYVFSRLAVVTEMLIIPESFERGLLYVAGPDGSEAVITLIQEILSVFWRTGVQIILFLSGLQAIPDSLYEAARVDNANSWDMLWKITLPMLSPVILLNTIYTVIDSFRDSSNPLVEYIIKQIFEFSQFDIGSAMGWLYFIVVFIFIGLIFLISRKAVYYEK